MAMQSMTAEPHDAEEDLPRIGTSVKVLQRDILDNLFYTQARFPAVATTNDWYMAAACTVRDRVLRRWVATGEAYRDAQSRTICYLSAEYLLGPHLGNTLLNLGIENQFREAVAGLDMDLADLLEQEEEPGLGNGGLGRLAACFMDSLATLRIPTIGYGIRYEFGIFDQEIRDGWQVEKTDKWLHLGNPWEIIRPEITHLVSLGGHTEPYRDKDGRNRVRWLPDRVVKGVAHDTPILGYRVNTVNLLRLWKAEAVESFDFDAFNKGDYYRAVDAKIISETISKILYPNDEPATGKLLRLAQQYFFVSCSLRDMIRIQFQSDRDITHFPDKYAVQLNDTHPSLAVVEMMRLLVDEFDLAWEPAWDITCRTFAYTNHTLLPEALEKWPVELFHRLLPRHLELVFEINQRFLDEVRVRFPGDAGRLRRMSLIDEEGERYVRMAHLACVGSNTINGVAALHSELLVRETLHDFYEFFPEKFCNKTNGVTPRRFVALANPGLSDLITDRIGSGWLTDLYALRQLEPLAEEPLFQEEWRQVKLANKKLLAKEILKRTGTTVDPHSMFDIQIKRLHEYKRQHLNVLHIIALYLELKRDPQFVAAPRTVLFAGKAAPGYFMAKLIIKLITSVAEVVNNDPSMDGLLKVVFFPDYNVKSGQCIFPAADLSEQISTAGKEASGTGNMKLAMNGALTIGTLDGANVEIREEVGAENFFLFGLNAQEVADLKNRGYNPRGYYESNPRLKEAIDLIAGGHFSQGDRQLFRPLVDSLLHRDEYMLFADFDSYLDCQSQVSKLFLDSDGWVRKSILNAARMGKFSSDRAIREYSEQIWNVHPVDVEL